MSELLKINVNEHTEKKNGLTYLSWAWAWAEVLKIDPQAEWSAVEYHVPSERGIVCMPCMMLADGSAMVKTHVKIKGVTRECMLPVMDHRNKAIKNPDAFAVNTALMRCLAKCIAMHGLGLYIYAGEDLPEDDGKKSGKPLDGAGDGLDADTLKQLDELASYMVECHAEGRELETVGLFYNLPDNDQKVYVWKQLGPWSKLRAFIKANSPHNKETA